MNQSIFTNRKSFHMKSQNVTNSQVIFGTQTNIAFVLKFIKLVKTKSSWKFQNNDVNSITLIVEEILASKEYLFRKAALEVKKFIKPTQCQKISIEKDSILCYSGRILPTDIIKITGEMSTVMKDLAADTFCVPIIYKHSPLAYSLINKVHWHSKVAMHSGVEIKWNKVVFKIGFIIFRRDLMKKIKIQYERCKYLRKKVIDVSGVNIKTQNHNSSSILCNSSRYLWSL